MATALGGHVNDPDKHAHAKPWVWHPLGERIIATPAIANDTLYVRSAGHLLAFREIAGK